MKNIFDIFTHTKQPTLAEQKSQARIIVIWLRRYIRTQTDILLRDRARIKSLKAFAAKLEKDGTPFDTDRIGKANVSIFELERYCSRRHEFIKKCGRMLAEFAPAIDAVLSLQERCDLLNINVADRADLTEGDGIVHLIHVHHLEDSAEHRGEDFATGPMHWALALFFADWLCDTNEGKQVADEVLWGPGGMFEFLPTYTRQADGSFTRNPPPLRLA